MENIQNSLFFERIEDALDEVIRACGGRKKMAALLWTTKPERDRHNLIDACLNPARPEKFSPAQVIFILQRGREVGCHSAMHYINSEAGYAAAAPVDPEDELAALQRNFIEASKSMSRTADRIERLMAAKPALRQVS